MSSLFDYSSNQGGARKDASCCGIPKQGSCCGECEYVIPTNCIPPIISSNPEISVIAGQDVNYTLTATEEVIFNVIGLPSWLVFDGVNNISGTSPEEANHYTFTAVGTNSCGQSKKLISVSVISIPPDTSDFTILRFHWDEEDGTDLDTRTCLTDVDTTYNFLDVGWCRFTTVGPAGSPYLTWGGDNTGPAGFEAVLIDFKKMGEDYPTLSQIIIRIRANWYGTRTTGNFTLSVVSYVGGVIEVDPTDPHNFINVGGVLTQDISVNRNSTSNIAGCVDGDEQGTLHYDTSTKIVTINPP